MNEFERYSRTANRILEMLRDEGYSEEEVPVMCSVIAGRATRQGTEGTIYQRISTDYLCRVLRHSAGVDDEHPEPVH